MALIFKPILEIGGYYVFILVETGVQNAISTEKSLQKNSAGI